MVGEGGGAGLGWEAQHPYGDLGELTEAGITARADRGCTLTPDGDDLCTDLMRLERWANRWAARLR